jgi:hypothetical protein
MIVSAHQPLFLPWLGFFDKVRRADVFVLVDHVQFEKQDFQNRNRIQTRAGVRWLVVPVRHQSRDERICDKEIDDKPDGRTTWGERLASTLRHAYARTPFAKRYLPFLEDALTRPWRLLVDLDIHLIRYFLHELEIETPVVRSTTLEGVGGSRTEMILSVCQAVGADVYLSGNGGSREYLDVELLERNHIEVEWQAFRHPVYVQAGGGRDTFVPHLSVVDLLFNCGPASAAMLRGDGVLEWRGESLRQRFA